MKGLVAAAGLLAVTFFSTPTLAQPPGSDRDWDLSIGAGAAWAREEYRGKENEWKPLPLIKLDYNNFFIEGLKGGYRFIASDYLELDVRGNVRMAGYESSDSNFLRGMRDTDDPAFELGAGAKMKGYWGEVGLTALGDVSDEHNGVVIEGGYSYPFRGALYNRGYLFKPGLGLTWYSENYTDHYYGVRRKDEDLTIGRRQYDPDDSFSPFVGYSAFYFLDENWAIMHTFRFRWYDSEVDDSDLTERDDRTSLLLGVSYRF